MKELINRRVRFYDQDLKLHLYGKIDAIEIRKDDKTGDIITYFSITGEKEFKSSCEHYVHEEHIMLIYWQ